MGLLDYAKKYVGAKWFSDTVSQKLVAPVTGPFVIPQGAITVTRPGGFAPDGHYLDDIQLFLAPAQSQDMGALYTQRQLNESHDLKDALVLGELVVALGGTIPISDPIATVTALLASVQVKDIANTVINPATEDGNLATIVSLLSGGGSSAANVYQSASIAGGGVTGTILTYVVPVLKTLNITTLICWGDVDASYVIKVNGVAKGGGRSSIATPTLIIPYGTGSIKATTGQTVTVEGQQFSNAAHTLNATVAGSEL